MPSVALQAVERSGADAVIVEGTESRRPHRRDYDYVFDSAGVGRGRDPCDRRRRDRRRQRDCGCDDAGSGRLPGRAPGFLRQEECQIHQNYKELVLKAKDTDSAVTGRLVGLSPVRSVKNRYTKKLVELEKSGITAEEFENLTVGSLRKAVQDGNLEEGSFMAGQIAGMIHDVKPCKEIIEEMFHDAENLIRNFEKIRGVTLG